ncbi:MAG: hypothetical protein WCA11_10615 [Terracidiphilus sp.]
MKFSLGRCLYGAAAIAAGISALARHDIDTLNIVPHHEILTYIVAAIEIVAGISLQWPRAARAATVALLAIYFIFALLAVPFIVAHPLVYNSYGNVFEQLSLASGAAILYACCDQIVPARAARFAQIGYYSFAICVISFALEQLFYLNATASLVPKWIPPGQMFWAVATTVAFALAAIALLTGFKAGLAARLTAVMTVGFLLLTWLPLLFANPHSFENWSESAETLAIAASAWIVADYLSQRRTAKPGSRQK